MSASLFPYLYQITSTIISTILGAIWWSYRNMQSRLTKIEKETLTHDDARLLIQDKLQSVQTDIDNLKSQVSRIDANVMKLLEFHIQHGK